MYKYFQKRFALTSDGARDFLKGIIFTSILNISLMFPALIVYMFLEEYVAGVVNSSKTGEFNSFWYYVLAGAGFMIIMYIIARYQYSNTYTKVYNESEQRRINLAEKLRKLPLAFFGEKDLSDLTSTIMEDCLQLEHTFSHSIPQLFASLVSITLISAGLLMYNWQMTMAMLWVVPAAAMIIFFSKKIMSGEHSRLYSFKRDVSEQIQEGIENIQEIKSCNQEEEYIRELDTGLSIMEKMLVKGELIVGVLMNFSHAILKLGLASVIIYGSHLMSQGRINLLTYLVFIMVASRIFDPLIEVFNHVAVLIYLDVRIKRMRDMEAMPVQRGRSDYEIKNYDIEFHNVDFSYENDKPVLKNVSFKAKQGEVTALIGPSGGGKSTSVKLAARFWDIDRGEITLGGSDISDIDPEALLKNYAVVFQDVVLFRGTVMDNIRIGRENATDQEVIEAARMAQCHNFISGLPQGYNTVIGENGSTLSGGERQRISIARALLKDAPVILLDEATASVDVENETKIQKAISKLIKGKTVLIIAHRMRTVSRADKIIVLKNGQVAESGSAKQLIKKRTIFYNMIEKQKKSA